MKCVAFCNCSGEDQIRCNYLTLLHQRHNKYLNSVCSEVNYHTRFTGENEKVDILENQLLTFGKSIVKEYYKCQYSSYVISFSFYEIMYTIISFERSACNIIKKILQIIWACATWSRDITDLLCLLCNIFTT